MKSCSTALLNMLFVSYLFKLSVVILYQLLVIANRFTYRILSEVVSYNIYICLIRLSRDLWQLLTRVAGVDLCPLLRSIQSKECVYSPMRAIINN